MRYCTPEEAGLSSADLRRFYDGLEEYHLSTHSVIFARRDRIFSECYYAPFHRGFLHRMYSVSKSFVSVAVGFCIQDGLLTLDAPIAPFFADELAADGAIPQEVTVRELLTMESGMRGVSWFRMRPTNRAETYFSAPQTKLPGTLFDYDSSGSYMLGVIVERLTGKTFLDYLKDKVLREIGFSEESYCIMAPGGHSFGDSGVMCTARDLLLFARFVLNRGEFNGKRYLNEEYLHDACRVQVENNDYGFAGHDDHGYGYQFWGAPQGCFAMLGMGNQIALCDPRHDLVFVINSDNQGNPYSYEEIFFLLYTHVIHRISADGAALPYSSESDVLSAELKEKKLFALRGPVSSPFKEKIGGKRYVARKNPMGIKWFTLEFSLHGGVFRYENAQGEKEMPFCFGENCFAQFPETGYSDLVASCTAPGNTYRAAFSADFPEEKKLRIRVQIIDKYFGNLGIVFGFRDENHVTVRMSKTAEDFLLEYNGVMIAEAEQESRS